MNNIMSPVLWDDTKITSKNFLLYCAKYYENPQCENTDEFYEDLERLKYIRKLITRYVDTGELRERLILNHLIILNNVFGPYHLSRILFFKMFDQMKYIKPFLVLLGILPKYVHGIGDTGRTVDTDDISMDDTIIRKLREI